MANYREIARRFPAVRDYFRHRKWVKRGDVVAYAPSTEGGAFSTDSFGFRHGEWNGARFGLAAAFDGGPYALVLGSSHVFGFGLAADAETIPSQLSALTGVRCVNISFPESNLRALHSVASRIVTEAPRKPDFICAFIGGDLTRYCFTRQCDALFGSPDFSTAAEAAPLGGAEEDAAFQNLLIYVRFWLGRHAALAEEGGAAFLTPVDSTVFNKSALSEVERACALGVTGGAGDAVRFDAYRLRHPAYEASAVAWLEARGLLAPTDAQAMTFIDEFHYDAASCGRMAAALAARLPRR